MTCHQENKANLNDLVELISQWAEDRGIYDHSTSNAQLLKAMSEMGELADAEIKNNHRNKVDAVGDVVVCLVSYAEITGFSFTDAVASAYKEIKDRKGRMVPGGAFVKEGDE